jgi:predicted ATPase
VDEIKILKGAVEEPLFALVEGGRDVPASVLSDGTLRFAAITAAFFQPDMPGVMTIEEVENGIHASRVRLLVELLRNRAEAKKTQIMVTTHSPLLLGWLTENEYPCTFLCARDDESGESTITPIVEIPHFTDTIREQSLSELFMEGWLEAAQ